MKYALPVVLALCVGSALHAQTPAAASTCSFSGRIADQLGAAISRAFVAVHSDRLVKTSRSIDLNDNGEFEVKLEPGMYDFFVGSRGFLPFAKEIDLRSCKPVALEVKLKVDLEHLED
jgi:hypothetical protein